MWRGAVIFLFLSVQITLINAKFFSEAGTYKLPANDRQPQPGEPLGSQQYYDLDLSRDNLSPYQQQQMPNNFYEDQRLAGIVDELRQMQPNNNFAELQNQPEDYQLPYYDEKGQVDVDSLRNLQPEAEKETPEAVIEPKTPIKTQKKGQDEFEGFVEPKASNQLKNVQYADKRVPVMDSESNVHSIHTLHSSGNIVFIAIVTMCCIVVVVGVVGGTYYYNHARKTSDNTFDDFTRYSPAGPGRDKKQKKVRGGSGGNITENGDESLAYKAQLHHYQQTKQKIIGAEEGMGGMPGTEMEDDKSDDELEEHNYSVYECPGLAPTGDIEVQNPNFDINKHHNASSP